MRWGAARFTYQNFGAFLGALAAQSGPFAADTITRTYANRMPQSLTLAQPGGGGWLERFSFDSLLRLTSVASPRGRLPTITTGRANKSIAWTGRAGRPSMKRSTAPGNC